MPIEPDSIRAQPALTTSTGRSWLVIGGAFAAISLAVLIPMTQLPPAGIALVGAIVVAALYLGMVVVRLTVPSGRTRLALLAVGMLVMAAVALTCAIVVAASASLV